MKILSQEDFIKKYNQCWEEGMKKVLEGNEVWLCLTDDYDLTAKIVDSQDLKFFKKIERFPGITTEEYQYQRYWEKIRYYEFKRLTWGITSARLAEIFSKSKTQIDAYSCQRTPVPDDVLAKALMLDKAISQIQCDDPRVQQIPKIGKVIGGKLYNTQTARVIKMVVENPMDAAHYECEGLYRTKTGHFFLAGLGGPQSRFSDHGLTGQRLILLTLEDAKLWMEKHATAEEYILFCGTPHLG